MADMAITMTHDEWDKILAVLAEHPFKTVNPLIHKIIEQARQQRAVAGAEGDRMVPRLQPVS